MLRKGLVIAAALLAMGAGSRPQAEDQFDLPMCVASTTQEKLALSAVTKSRRTVDFPKDGEVQTVEIGESMISTLDYSIYGQAIKLNAPLSFSGTPPETNRFSIKRHDFIVQAPVGRMFIAPGLTRYFRKPLYLAPNGTAARMRDGAVHKQAVVGIEIKGPDELQLIWGWQDAEWRSPPLKADYTVDYCGLWSEGDFRRDLVYSGVSQGTVLISYREFNDNLARPAFTQDVRYDLKDGAEVGFRGARFEILKATNTAITYRVLKTLGG